jgi:hypothetical protein
MAEPPSIHIAAPDRVGQVAAGGDCLAGRAARRRYFSDGNNDDNVRAESGVVMSIGQEIIFDLWYNTLTVMVIAGEATCRLNCTARFSSSALSATPWVSQPLQLNSSLLMVT